MILGSYSARRYLSRLGSSNSIRWHSSRPGLSTTEQVKVLNDVQQLYYTHETSPGSPFFTPRGTVLFTKLMTFVKLQMLGEGFREVITPQMYRKELWETSGHWKHYHEDMFSIDTDEGLALKPMNCPGHCILFKSRERSFRELPVRYADLSPLHRNEASGALTGLTRVRRFHQDDGHIFCRLDQVATEMSSALRLVNNVYSVFGLEYSVLLSTRPESFTGTLEQWDLAERGLREALECTEYTVNEGDGAFYGPKIDFVVKDKRGNQHQAATIQLDFQLPRRFDLSYDAEGGGKETPVMIHRAVLGSVERFLALLIDHYAGRWPFWLNPTQAVVIPVSDAHVTYAHEVSRTLRNLPAVPVPLTAVPFDVEVWDRAEPLGGKLRRARDLGISYAIVVGSREVVDKTISVRRRGERESQVMTPDALVNEFIERLEAYS